MELKDTVKMMNSNDYKERFKAEYWQLKIRADKLQWMLYRYGNNTLDFEPTCDFDFLSEQLAVMRNYLEILEIRAHLEDIELFEV